MGPLPTPGTLITADKLADNTGFPGFSRWERAYSEGAIHFFSFSGRYEGTVGNCRSKAERYCFFFFPGFPSIDRKKREGQRYVINPPGDRAKT